MTASSSQSPREISPPFFSDEACFFSTKSPDKLLQRSQGTGGRTIYAGKLSLPGPHFPPCSHPSSKLSSNQFLSIVGNALFLLFSEMTHSLSVIFNFSFVPPARLIYVHQWLCPAASQNIPTHTSVPNFSLASKGNQAPEAQPCGGWMQALESNCLSFNSIYLT